MVSIHNDSKETIYQSKLVINQQKFDPTEFLDDSCSWFADCDWIV